MVLGLVMNAQQFEYAVQMQGLKLDASATQAARMVLVDGVKGVDAAKTHGIKPPAVTAAVKKLRRMGQLAVEYVTAQTA